MPVITELRPAIAQIPKALNVCAYARVSADKDTMFHSLSAQISAYSEMIQKHPGWRYCGVYADNACTGTKEARAEFQRMLSDCRAGKIDMIITKSISRFARNTVTLLETVRELKHLGIDVFFEEQNIHTLDGAGELMLTILGSFAQEESLSVSENQKWRVKRNFEAGKPWNCTILGYRYDGEQFNIEPEEAEIVKEIFSLFLSGCGLQKIANTLNSEEKYGRKGSEWCRTTVRQILRNEDFTGSMLLQKTYSENHLTKKMRVNNGERQMYYVENSHEAIIDRATFDAAQAELDRRMLGYADTSDLRYAFSGMITCPYCGKHYRRKQRENAAKWMCGTSKTKGKAFCPDAKEIPEDTVLTAVCDVLGFDSFNEGVFKNEIAGIEAHKGNILRFVFADGRTDDYKWRDRSRAESWTPEMRQKAHTREMERQEWLKKQ